MNVRHRPSARIGLPSPRPERDAGRGPVPWLLAALQTLAVGLASAQTQSAPSDVYDYSRQSAFEYEASGVLKREVVEPGRAELCVQTTHTLDGWGNKAGVLTQPCAGASATARFADRSAASVYGAQTVTVTVGGVGAVSVAVPAGSQATAASNALGHTEERSYDPRFGAVLSVKGPNGLSTRWSVDDFGRVIREDRADGTATVTEHCIITGRGLDTSSNTAGCGSTAALSGRSDETPAQAVSWPKAAVWPLD